MGSVIRLIGLAAAILATASTAEAVPQYEPAATIVGTLKTVDGNSLAVEVEEGNVVPVRLTRKTRIVRGKSKAKASALQAGDRVSADVQHAPDGKLDAVALRAEPAEK